MQALQQSIQEGLDKYCPRASPSPRASRKWTPWASKLLVGVHWARHEYLASELPHHLQALRSHQNLLKKELCKSNRNMWCRFVGEATASSDTPYNQGLWRLLRWSHSKASQQCLQMPPLHCREGDPLAFSNKDKAKILAEKLFPAPSEVDLSDLPNGPAPAVTLDIPPDISPELLQQTISCLLSSKVAAQTASQMKSSNN